MDIVYRVRNDEIVSSFWLLKISGNMNLFSACPRAGGRNYASGQGCLNPGKKPVSKVRLT
jgi:hypothetical protein